MSSFRAVAEQRYCADISVPFAFFVHLAESNVYSSESSRSGCGMMQKRKLLVLFSQIPYKTSFYVELVQTPVCLVCVCVSFLLRENAGWPETRLNSCTRARQPGERSCLDCLHKLNPKILLSHQRCLGVPDLCVLCCPASMACFAACWDCSAVDRLSKSVADLAGLLVANRP